MELKARLGNGTNGEVDYGGGSFYGLTLKDHPMKLPPGFKVLGFSRCRDESLSIS